MRVNDSLQKPQHFRLDITLELLVLFLILFRAILPTDINLDKKWIGIDEINFFAYLPQSLFNHHQLVCPLQLFLYDSVGDLVYSLGGVIC